METLRTDKKPPALSESAERFVLHWGEMGARWGISRAVAQIHALLLISKVPLHAQQISEMLSLARSNVSTGLRELQSWGIVSVVHVLGDRRDHFQASKDIWQMLAVIADRRLEREIEPTIELLRQLQGAGEKKGEEVSRIAGELLEVFEAGTSFFRRLRSLPIPLVKKVLRWDQKFTKALDSLDKRG